MWVRGNESCVLPVCVQMPERLSEEKQEEALLMRSDLWKNLFRGGYITGKNTRSLSGTYVSLSTKSHPRTACSASP